MPSRGFWTAWLFVASGLLCAAQSPDFSNIVLIGDSLTAGFVDGGLHEHGQEHALGSLISEQVGHPVTNPLVSYPGIPICLTLAGFDANGLPILVPAGTTMGSLLNPLQQPTNLAVPGHTSLDCLSKAPEGAPDSLTDLILGFPGHYLGGQPALSQVELAAQLNPTFVLLWIGANDALGGALSGDPANTIPTSVFSQTFPAILEALLATGAQAVVGNIPDPTVVPALTSGRYLKDLGVPLRVLRITPADYVTPAGMAHVKAILAGTAQGPLDPSEVLTRKEAEKIKKLVIEDNKVIAKACKAAGVPVVDVFKELKLIHNRGYELPNGQRIFTSFLGGIFSLDGVHPTYTGQAIVANAFIDAINDGYGTAIPHVDVMAENRKDPLGVAEAPVLPQFDLGAYEPILSRWQ
ncbi:MAG: SGNH/GDSL hydrolase family protein [Acidobacteriota bacterium]